MEQKLSQTSANLRGSFVSLTSGMREYGLLASLIVIVVFFQIATGGVLLQPLNVTNLVLQNSYIVIMALGMLMVIVSGHIDLSVGSIVGVVGALAGVLVVQYQVDIFTAAIACIALGAFIGALQGYCVAWWGMPSFIVTLGGMLVFRGATVAITSGQSLGPFPETFRFFASGFVPDIVASNAINTLSLLVGAAVAVAFLLVEYRERRRAARRTQVGPLYLFVLKHGVLAAMIMFFCFLLARYQGIPAVLVTTGLLVAAYTFVMNRTVFGRRIYAVGGNQKAAQLSGVNTMRLTFLTFVNMGVLAAIAGLIFVGRLNSATPRGGMGFELDVIAAVFIGGASASGGVGKVLGVVVGAFIMGVLNNGMSILGIGVDYQQMIKGMVLVAAVFIDMYQKNKS